MKFINDLSLESLLNLKQDLFNHDLSHRPFRFSGLKKEFIGHLAESFNLPDVSFYPLSESISHSKPYRYLNELKKILEYDTKGLPFGLIFPTRPFSLTELYLIDNDLFNISRGETPLEDHSIGGQLKHLQYNRPKIEKLNDIIFGLRGFQLSQLNPELNKAKNNISLMLSNHGYNENIRIAVASWFTDVETYKDTLNSKKNVSIGKKRYIRLIKLINAIIHSKDKIHYLVLPELAIPTNWFLTIARRLKSFGISLIAGVDYIKSSDNTVQNQVWSNLVFEDMHFTSSIIYMQDKQKAAPREFEYLNELDPSLKLEPLRSWEFPPIIKHGDFIFSIVICSELTNIDYRAYLRGKVDALFIPEWNKDINYFNSIVESASVDMHTYIVQCNNRIYGDSRIRAPYKNTWEKDLVQVRGGSSDFYVIGEIDIKSLRNFHSKTKETNSKFKPLPDGFTSSHERRAKK